MLGTILGHRYEILDSIGEGGMAGVYKAMDLTLGREVAVKVIHQHLAKNSEFRQRFQQEASIAAKLEHPNIVKIFDYAVHEDGRAYIVSELVRGENFHIIETNYLSEKDKPLPMLVGIAVCMEVLKGLDHAHSQNCIHRDVKPDNVLISKDGEVKLTDFGIAKNIGASMTMAGRFLGSPSYSSPEQVLGQPVEKNSDLYAVGIILYEAMTGELPFRGANISEIMAKIAQGRYTSLKNVMPEVPPELEAIVAKALKTSVQQRYQNANDFLKDLQTLADKYGMVSSRKALEDYFVSPRDFEKKYALQSQRKNERAASTGTYATTEGSGTANLREKTTIESPSGGLRKLAPLPEDRSYRKTRLDVGLPTNVLAPKRSKAKIASQAFRQVPVLSRRIMHSIRQNVRPYSYKNSGSSSAWVFMLIAALVGIFLVAVIVKNSGDSAKTNVTKDERKKTEENSSKRNKTETKKTAPKPATVNKFASPPRAALVEKSSPPKIEKARPAPIAKAPTRPSRAVTSSASEKDSTPESVQNTFSNQPKAAPAPQAPTSTAPGKVVLQTIPSGVPVLINGRFMGRTSGSGSLEMELPKGNYSLTLQGGRINGVRYESARKSISVDSGKTNNVGMFKLAAIRTLIVRISGPNVIVKINGDPYPTYGNQLELQMPEGRINISAWAENGKSLTRSIDLKGEDFVLNASLE